jgi:hypothetical protein
MSSHNEGMTAVACLRVLLPENDTVADPEALAALVAKLGGAYLETRWKWPKRWGAIAAFAFGLADPRANRLDPLELQALSTELHHKLFGDREEGEVCLVALEGRQEDIMRFAAADAALLREMIERGGAAIYGHLTAVTPTSITPLATLDTRPAYPDETPALPPEDDPDALPPSVDHGFHGVFHTVREIFIGAVVSARADSRTPLWSVVDGLRDMPLHHHHTDHDLACLSVAAEAVARPGGVLFVPINFSALVHGAARRAYEPAIAALPATQRHRLAATVYDTPRDPSWTAMSQLKGFLGLRFAFVDLQVADPAFAVDKLPEDGGVTSVTFALPDGDEKLRLMAARRFMSDLAGFRRSRVWPGLTNIRTRRELAACASLKAPFVTGRAVTAALRAPPDASVRPVASLPLRGEQVSDRPRQVAAA